MFLFLFSILPISLIVFFLISKESKYLPVVFIGALTAILVCGYNAFFLTSHRLIPISVYENCIYYLHRQTLFPILIIYAVYLIVTNDTWEFKFKSFFPLFTAFFMIYMPFFFLKGHNVNYSLSELFIFPLLQFFMIFTISCLLSQNTKAKVPVIILNSFVIILYLVLPAYLESLFILNEKITLRTILTVLYILVPVAGCVIDIIFNKKKVFVIEK